MSADKYATRPLGWLMIRPGISVWLVHVRRFRRSGREGRNVGHQDLRHRIDSQILQRAAEGEDVGLVKSGENVVAFGGDFRFVAVHGAIDVGAGARELIANTNEPAGRSAPTAARGARAARSARVCRP